MPKSEWEQFFDGHAPVYMQNCFVTNTLAEVDFILEILQLPESGSILDMGCGAGRHSVELAKRGYKVTGVDLSQGMLNEAEKSSKEAGVDIELIKANAAEYVSDKQFDGAICLCEGAFCLLSAADDHIERDLAILRNISNSLKPGSRFVLTVLNGLRKARLYSQEDVEKGIFDPVTMTDKCTMDWDTSAGKGSVEIRERGYVPTEISLLFKLVGFEVEHIWGGTAGNWGRRRIDLDEIEIMIVGRKK